MSTGPQFSLTFHPQVNQWGLGTGFSICELGKIRGFGALAHMNLACDSLGHHVENNMVQVM